MTILNDIRVAVLVDEMKVAVWQGKALRTTFGTAAPLSIYSCMNSRSTLSLFKHAAYYVLALLCVRNPQTRLVPIGSTGVSIGSVTNFAAETNGGWQSLPTHVLAQLQNERPEVIIKFGMGLLRIPDDLEIPVLSYHHGDPSAFRGRPAGFHEMDSRTPVMGQIVQRLSNKLDAGTVLSFGETKVYPSSYRKTLVEAYRHSPWLLRSAIMNARAGRAIDKRPSGRNYRLPTNLQVSAFVLRMTGNAAYQLVYGALIEKRWQVCVAPASDPGKLVSDGGALPAGAIQSIDPRYTFMADPFFWKGETMLAEALNRRSGQGEIVALEKGATRCVSPPGGHFSYPAPVEERGETFVVPETASWSPPTIYRLGADGLVAVQPLAIEEDVRLLDPTFLRSDGTLYLFANRADLGPNLLFLWWADSLFDRFRSHPHNPIAFTPRGARMAGCFVRTEDSLIRLGQDGGRDYGNGIFSFAVTELSTTTYQERQLDRICVPDAKGPHTINLTQDRVVYDFYRESMSPLAGVRRLRARIASR